jgi:hypothetical protein
VSPSVEWTAHDMAGLDGGDHLLEIAEILAAGLTRLGVRKSSRKPAEFGESSLHFSPDQSGGVPPYSPEVPHD